MANQKKNSGFMAWYESYKGQRVVGIVYSVGASVVIIGALFKILHWQGASIVLMIGMFTEAFLFIIGALDKPHATYHWEEVFPQLLGHGADPMLVAEKAGQPRPTLLGGAGSASSSAASATAPGLAEGDVKALKESIANVAATANSLADLGKLAEGSNKLSEKLAAAAEATDKFAGAQTGVAQAADNLGANYVAAAKAAEAIKNDTEAAAQSQAAAAKNLAALNAAYELNLKSAQNAAQEAAKLADANIAAAKSSEAFAAAQDKLAKQVADLNKVYGNMLSAIA